MVGENEALRKAPRNWGQRGAVGNMAEYAALENRKLETLRFIRKEAESLRNVANDDGFEFLSYILKLAISETELLSEDTCFSSIPLDADADGQP